jgi:hypothetical protein
MCIHVPKGTIFWAGLLILLGACNQMDTVLPSMGSYRVNALVNLVVYLEDSKGKRAGSGVRYSTGPVPAGTDPVEADAPPESGEPGAGKTETGDSEAEGNPPESVPELVSKSIIAVSSAGDLVIPVNSFTGQLPPFPIAGDMEIGYYTMVFEIRGTENLLSRAERRIFYTGDQEFTSGGLRYYLPGLYGNKHLVPQGSNVMLETQVSYGKGLEPYIIWYNGSRKIGEGPVADGTARLFWKASQQTGFHTIRAELFPFAPQTATKGVIKELSLPVSSDAGENRSPSGTTAAGNKDFLYRYQLAGDLREEGAGAALSRASPETTAPLWYPAEQIYGLALNEGDSYEASPKVLDLSAVSGDTEGLLRFFVRFLPLNDGTILSALLGSGANSTAIRLFVAENAPRFELEGGNGKVLSDPLEIDGAYGSFMGLVLDVEIRETGLMVSLEPAASPDAGKMGNAPVRAAELKLNSPIQGELRSWLGDVQQRDSGDRTETSEHPADSVPLGSVPGDSVPTSSVSAAEEIRPASPPVSVPAPVAVVDDFSALFRVSAKTGGEPRMETGSPQTVPEGTALEGTASADSAGVSQTRTR